MGLVKELPIPEKMADQRYFEIANADSQGNGSFLTYCVTGGTLDSEIMQIACELHMDDMERLEKFYTPGMFREPPQYRRALKCKELTRRTELLDPNNENHARRMERTGRNYQNIWSTKRGGLKFTIELGGVTLKTNRGVYQSRNYKPGHIISRGAQNADNS